MKQEFTKLKKNVMKMVEKWYSCCDKTIVLEEKEIIKQADTIEELCDEYVGVVGNMHRQLTGTNIRSWNDCAIYGAIWTEWGLKYVAKLNEKGELELL